MTNFDISHVIVKRRKLQNRIPAMPLCLVLGGSHTYMCTNHGTEEISTRKDNTDPFVTDSQAAIKTVRSVETQLETVKEVSNVFGGT